MPPVGAAVAGLLGLSTTGLVASAITGLVEVAASFGLSFAAKALAGKPETVGGGAIRPAGVQVQLRAGDTLSRFFIAGTWATAGQLVYLRNWGDAGKTPHAYLVQVIVLSHISVTQLAGVFVDGAPVTWTPGGAQTGNGQAIQEYHKDGKDHLWIRFYDGTQTAADGYLTGKFPSGTRAWASTHVGKGMAYVIVTSRWNPKLFDRAPELKFEVRGIPLYDITKDTTAGGSGSQRWATPSTWAHSRNPAVIVYNLMRGIRFEGEWVYGLQMVGAAQLPYSAWAAAINECDILITNADASTEPQFQAGGEISFATEPGEEIEEFLKSCNGRLADCGGVYKPKVGAAGAAVMSFTDDALMLTDAHSFAPFPSLNDTVNGIDASYISPEEGWVPKAAPPRRNATYETADGGRRSIADIAYAHVSGKRQVQRLTKAALLEERRFRRHVVVLPPDYGAAEPLDMIGWTSTRNDYTAKLFRIDTLIDRDNLDVVAGLTEVDPSDYDWTAGSDEVATTDAPIDLERPAAQEVLAFTASGEVSTGDDGRTIAVIRVNWNAGVDDVDRVKFVVRKGTSAGAVICRDETSAVDAGTYDVSKNINGVTTYVVQAVFDSAASRRDFTPSAWLSVATPNTQVPMAVLAASLQALINQGSAAGKVITEQLSAATAALYGFQTLYRITVYGTGPTPAETGLYLYVTAAGVPGVIIDASFFAVGPLAAVAGDTAKLKLFPFVLDAGVIKIKRGNIQKIQAGQIDAGAIDADKIVGGSVCAFLAGTPATGTTATHVNVPYAKGDSAVQLVANFSYGLEAQGGAITVYIGRAKSTANLTYFSSYTALPNAMFTDVNLAPSSIDTLAASIVAFDQPGDPGKGVKWVYALLWMGSKKYKPGSTINAILLRR